MKKIIKGFSSALITLGLSTSALASPFCVTVPDQQGGFGLGADALWLRPSVPNNTYNATVFIPTAGNPFNVNVNLQNVNPSYKLAFDLIAAYRFPCTGLDVTAIWTHLNSSNNGNNSTTQTYNLNPQLLTVDSSASTSFKYDAIDIDLGQRVNFGDYFNFRIFTGVRGVQIEQQQTNNYGFTLSNPPPLVGAGPQTELDFFQTTKLEGLGPQMGLEGRYCLGYGFGIDASAVLSALIGRSDCKATVDFTNFTATPPTITTVNFDTDSKDRVVPTIDVNLGADYTFNFNYCSRSSLVVQAGYKIIHYWNVGHMFINNIGPNNANSISFDGPYLGLKINV